MLRAPQAERRRAPVLRNRLRQQGHSARHRSRRRQLLYCGIAGASAGFREFAALKVRRAEGQSNRRSRRCQRSTRNRGQQGRSDPLILWRISGSNPSSPEVDDTSSKTGIGVNNVSTSPGAIGCRIWLLAALIAAILGGCRTSAEDSRAASSADNVADAAKSDAEPIDFALKDLAGK